MKKNKKKEWRRPHYGIVKVKAGTKLCWLSQQNKHGWSLGLALNKHTVWLRNVRFATLKDVKMALSSKNIVFVHLKNSH
jgi:uncharacterized protein YgiM (DUF1202 family)